MKIELKKIQHSPSLSEETEAFTANLYINGVNAGYAKNQGHGGPTDYGSYEPAGRELIRQAEEFCLKLPAKEFPADEGMEAFSLEMSLEHYIDGLLSDHLQKKELARFNRQMEKAMVNGIVYGVAGESYATISYKVPLIKVLEHPKGEETLIKALTEKVIPKLGDGKVLNHNIPEHIFQKAGLDRSQYIKPTVINEGLSAQRDASRSRGR